jgi:hypothetical protein
MKALHDPYRNPMVQNLTNELAACVEAVFDRYPMLCGFTVQARATLAIGRTTPLLQSGLYLADVEVSSPPGYSASEDLCGETASMLLELIDELPEVLDLLRGRTFARTFH